MANAVGWLILVGGIVVGVEALKHLSGVSAASAALGVTNVAPGSNESASSPMPSTTSPNVSAPGVTNVAPGSNESAGSPMPGGSTNPTNSDIVSGTNRLTDAQIAQGLYNAGMPLSEIPKMTAVLLAENNGYIGGISQAVPGIASGGAVGFAQFLPSTYIGLGGNPADLGSTDPNAIQRVFNNVVKLWNQQGFKPWNTWDYSSNYNYVGPDKGVYLNFMQRGLNAVQGLSPNNPNNVPSQTVYNNPAQNNPPSVPSLLTDAQIMAINALPGFNNSVYRGATQSDVCDWLTGLLINISQIPNPDATQAALLNQARTIAGCQ